MADLKLQVQRQLKIVPSDTIGIPDPSTKAASGTQTSATASKLTDTAATFETDGIKVGYIVHDETGGSIATVTAVDSETVLSLSADIFTATESYSIYAESTRDASWYVGVSGDVAGIDASGEAFLLVEVPTGWQPLQIQRIDSTNTTATDLVAGW